jgi:hypothetical protein
MAAVSAEPGDVGVCDALHPDIVFVWNECAILKDKG